MERFIERSLDQRVRGVIRARACTDRAKECSDRTHAERKREIDIYIYIKARFFRLDQNQQILPRNKRTPSLFIRSRDRTSFRTFHHRCVPSRRRNSSQTFRKILWNIQFSYFYLNLEKSYNIYKIIFYINIIYFITFSFVNNFVKSILKI